ncbi:hypothetical protein TFLX_04608 [Thermoflexales bacterium]|nr:hypothetical protein TFLX_04608 [Thermoflexales bacterium]
MFFLKHLITLLCAVLLFSACKTLEVGVERTRDSRVPAPSPTIKVSQVATTVATESAIPALAQAQLTITPALTPTPDPPVQVGLPQAGVLYLGFMGSDPSSVLFFRSPASTEEPHLGEVLYSDRKDWGHYYSFNFQELSQPRAVFTADDELSLYSGRENGNLLYVSFSVERTPPCPPTGANEQPQPCPTKEAINRVIEIDRSTLVRREIWANRLYDITYTASDTSAMIDQAVGPLEPGGGSFLVLRVAPCCDGILSQPHVMLVVNVASGKEMFLGDVGNVNVDSIEKVVSYQKLGTQRLKCGPDRVVGCDQDGYWTLYEPSGELLKQPLP